MLSGLRVLVAGEAILDRYQEGEASRISREAPVPVISSTRVSHRCGGAANAAANVASLGSKATLVSPLGRDDAGGVLRKLCAGSGIDASFIESDVPTPTKTRVLSSRQQLLRIDECKDQSAHADALADAAEKALPGHDVLLVSDYGLGAAGEAARIIKAASDAGIPSVVDPRGEDWSRYKNATLVKPNLEELGKAHASQTGSLEERALALMEEHGIGSVLLTQGAEGMTYFGKGGETETLATRKADVYDVTGAGDTVAAVMALGLAAGAPAGEAMRWANVAAGVVVGKFGATVVSREELVSEPGGHGGRVIDLEGMAREAEAHREAGRRIVLTNGCFDIVHAGHLETLSAAARLGDLLVVCVNDDESVAELKGPDRPVVPIEERLKVLAGLGSVDYALPFSGRDAAELVRRIKPDAYVKGGDWRDSEPPEAKAAAEVGATVVYTDMRPDVSTTEIITRIAERKG